MSHKKDPSKRVPLKLGVGGEVIGSVDVEIVNNDVHVTGIFVPAEVSEKLFGRYSAGGFSMAPPSVKPKLCYFCGANKCDDLIDNYDYCLCCRDGHVQ